MVLLLIQTLQPMAVLVETQAPPLTELTLLVEEEELLEELVDPPRFSAMALEAVEAELASLEGELPRQKQQQLFPVQD
jgi:hypothetical protein